ncbi:MAG: polysaccharide deacetylase family protein [candidate division WOR-3 bacterium]|nr:polysaccharide deacetylase family protein [candidate division WOR-3 bacterium]
MKPVSHIGVNMIGEGNGWMKILSQEGVPVNRESDIWIVNRKTDGVRDFVCGGGAVLTTPEYIERDILRELHIERRIKEKGKGIKEMGDGILIVLPFDPDTVFEDSKRKRKCFYSEYGRFPDETVSCISKAKARRTVVECIRELFARKGIPYIHKWYYPKGRSLFALRVDTDFAPAEKVVSLETSLQKINLKATFFLDVRVLKNHLSPILEGNHSFGIHCYNHTVYPDRKRNYENIKTAKELVEKEGMRLKGFAAPYGIWRREFPEILEELGFSYSSEFSYSYDDFPFFPDRKRNLLQIPVHPICIESLLMSKHTKEGVRNYFTSLIERNSLMGEPTIIYSHPDALVENFDILKKIVNYAREKGDIWIIDMDEIDEWWRRRESIHLSAIMEGDIIKFKEKIPIPVEIILPDGRQTICNLDRTVDISKLSFSSPRPISYPNEPQGNKLWLFLREVESRFYMLRTRIKERSNFLDID